MSQCYVCRACRIRSALQIKPSHALQQRQWQSQIAQRSRRHPQQEPASGFSDRSGYARQKGQAHSRRETFEPIREDHNRNDLPRGRYSGQVLLPEQVLDELDEASSHDSRRQGVPPEAYNKSQKRSTRSSPRTLPISSGLLNKCYDFVRVNRDNNDDRALWSILQSMVQEYSKGQLKELYNRRSFRSGCFHWMLRITKHYARDLTSDQSNEQHSNELPRPHTALALLTYIACFDDVIFPAVLWPLATAVSELQSQNVEANPTARDKELDGIRELMNVWNLCMSFRLRWNSDKVSIPKGVMEHADPVKPMDWSFLPSSIAFEEDLQRETLSEGRRSVLDSLFMLVPWVPHYLTGHNNEGQIVYDFVPSMLVTLDILRTSKSQSRHPETVNQCESWVKLIEIVIKHAHSVPAPAALAEMQSLEDEGLRDHYDGMVERLGLAASTLVRQRTQKHTIEEKPALPAEESESGLPASILDMPELDHVNEKSGLSEQFTLKSIKRLGRAREQSNLAAAERVYEDMRKFVSDHPGTQVNRSLYEHLLLTLLSLRNEEKAIAVWNDLIQASHQPRAKTFTVMMRGSYNVRDWESMESFWRKMRQSGVQPDIHAWTVRISGLLRSRAHREQGLKALDEMGQEWIAAARAAISRNHPSKKKSDTKSELPLSELLSRFEDSVDDVPRPSQVLYNAAISALAPSEDSKIPKVISWGRSFGIQPDLTAYNVLINVSMRRGLPEEAAKILQRMKQRGIDADQATWTILLNAMFKNRMLDNLTPEEQETRVLATLNSVSGVDEKAYALAIDRLLKIYNNHRAARAVLDNMFSKGMQPSPHIYTILMTSFFQRSPPDFAAAESLWSRIKSSDADYGASLDSQFYDRMIEAYSTHHRTVGTAPMLNFLSQMEKEGKKPSWKALESVARALAEANEFQRLSQLVERARRRLSAGRVGVTSRWGQRDFWQFILSTGVLDYTGLRTPEQIMSIHKEGGEQLYQ